MVGGQQSLHKAQFFVRGLRRFLDAIKEDQCENQALVKLRNLRVLRKRTPKPGKPSFRLAGANCRQTNFGEHARASVLALQRGFVTGARVIELSQVVISVPSGFGYESSFVAGMIRLTKKIQRVFVVTHPEYGQP